MSEGCIIPYQDRENWYNRTEKLFHLWNREGKLIDKHGQPINDGRLVSVIDYINWLFGLPSIDYVKTLYRRLHSGELQLDWIFSEHAYTIYRALVAKRIEADAQGI